MSDPAPDTGSHVAAPAPAIDRRAQARSRRLLLLIVGCFAIPLLLAFIWLQMVQSSDGDLGSTARGELIDPAVPLEAFSLPTLEQSPLVLDDVRGLWTLMYLPRGSCDKSCRLNLYHMRQVRLSLNHRMDRVQRLVVIEASEQLDDALLAEHPGLRVADGSGPARATLEAQIDAATSGMAPQQDGIYIIDPLGNLMMRFAPNLPPGSMLKDLKHLLKVSRIG